MGFDAVVHRSQPLQVILFALERIRGPDKVGAFAFDPTSRDTAILVTLAPGVYSAHVRSSSGAAGTALIEVYEVR